jgi:hypothetical protein
VPPVPSGSPFENELKENPHFADFVKYMGLKLVGTKFTGVKEAQNIKETENGHAADDSLNAEDANPDEEDPGDLGDPEL